MTQTVLTKQLNQGEWITGANENGQTCLNKNDRSSGGIGAGNAAGAGRTGEDKTDSPTESYEDTPKFGAPAKLPEGWHYAERYGEVYISPGGIAWIVQAKGIS